MDNIITAEVIATIGSLLTLFIAGIPIAFLTAIVVQIGKWVGLFESYGAFAVRRVAVIHSMLLGALWIGLQFYPTYVPIVTIVILGLYGSIMGAFLYEKVWTRIAGALGWDFTVDQLKQARDKVAMTEAQFESNYGSLEPSFDEQWKASKEAEISDVPVTP